MRGAQRAEVGQEIAQTEGRVGVSSVESGQDNFGHVLIHTEIAAGIENGAAGPGGIVKDDGLIPLGKIFAAPGGDAFDGVDGLAVAGVEGELESRGGGIAADDLFIDNSTDDGGAALDEAARDRSNAQMEEENQVPNDGKDPKGTSAWSSIRGRAFPFR